MTPAEARRSAADALQPFAAAPRVLVYAAAEAAASCAALTLACRAVAVAAAYGRRDAVSHDRALVPVAAEPAAAALLSAAAAARSPHRAPADAVHVCACASPHHLTVHQADCVLALQAATACALSDSQASACTCHLHAQ